MMLTTAPATAPDCHHSAALALPQQPSTQAAAAA